HAERRSEPDEGQPVPGAPPREALPAEERRGEGEGVRRKGALDRRGLHRRLGLSLPAYEDARERRESRGAPPEARHRSEEPDAPHGAAGLLREQRGGARQGDRHGEGGGGVGARRAASPPLPVGAPRPEGRPRGRRPPAAAARGEDEPRRTAREQLLRG